MLLLLVGAGFSYWLKFREVHERYGRSAPDVRVCGTFTPQPATESLQPVAVRSAVRLARRRGVLSAGALGSDLPERFPVHWGADGQPNGWATRSFQGVYGPLLLAAFMDVFFLLFAMALLRMSRNTTMRHVTITHPVAADVSGELRLRHGRRCCR